MLGAGAGTASCPPLLGEGAGSTPSVSTLSCALCRVGHTPGRHGRPTFSIFLCHLGKNSTPWLLLFSSDVSSPWSTCHMRCSHSRSGSLSPRQPEASCQVSKARRASGWCAVGEDSRARSGAFLLGCVSNKMPTTVASQVQSTSRCCVACLPLGSVGGRRCHLHSPAVDSGVQAPVGCLGPRDWESASQTPQGVLPSRPSSAHAASRRLWTDPTEELATIVETE